MYLLLLVVARNTRAMCLLLLVVARNTTPIYLMILVVARNTTAMYLLILVVARNLSMKLMARQKTWGLDSSSSHTSETLKYEYKYI